MSLKTCSCGHEKRDHNIMKSNNYGACKICLCNSYQADEKEPAPAISAVE